MLTKLKKLLQDYKSHLILTGLAILIIIVLVYIKM